MWTDVTTQNDPNTVKSKPFPFKLLFVFFFLSLMDTVECFFFFFFTLNVQIHEARPCCLKINTVRNKHVLKYYGMVEMVSS